MEWIACHRGISVSEFPQIIICILTQIEEPDTLIININGVRSDREIGFWSQISSYPLRLGAYATRSGNSKCNEVTSGRQVGVGRIRRRCYRAAVSKIPCKGSSRCCGVQRCVLYLNIQRCASWWYGIKVSHWRHRGDTCRMFNAVWTVSIAYYECNRIDIQPGICMRRTLSRGCCSITEFP